MGGGAQGRERGSVSGRLLRETGRHREVVFIMYLLLICIQCFFIYLLLYISLFFSFFKIVLFKAFHYFEIFHL